MLELAPLIAFLLIAFSIGSNDTSNSFGICIGCRVLSLRTATLLLFILAILGLFLQGDKVMRTVGKEFVELSPEISAVAMAISALMIVSSNLRGFPVSTHQVIIGSLAGSALAYNAGISVFTLLGIIISWIVSPAVAGLIAVSIFMLLEKIFRVFPLLLVDRVLKAMMLISAMLIAYNTGANELATAMAPVIHAGISEKNFLAFLGAFLLWTGAILLSRRVIETVCKGITALDPRSGLSAHLGAGIAVLGFTTIGMPVSTTYAMIGGIASVGFLKGAKAVRVETLKKIIFNWFFAPLSSFFLSFFVAKML